MALAPRFAGQRWTNSGTSSTTTIHTLELFLDYVCPFSAKCFFTLYNTVLPMIEAKYPKKVQIIFRQQIQPWHPSSTLVHEAGVAVLKLAPDKFWPFSNTLFQVQEDYFDVSVVNETRNKTYERLAKLAGTVGVDEEMLFGLLKIADRPGEDGGLNSGNGVTDDVKFLVKANRLTGVHVTPTVLFNVSRLPVPRSQPPMADWQFACTDESWGKGVVENGISSSFSKEQWGEWLQKNIV